MSLERRWRQADASNRSGGRGGSGSGGSRAGGGGGGDGVGDGTGGRRRCCWSVTGQCSRLESVRLLVCGDLSSEDQRQADALHLAQDCSFLACTHGHVCTTRSGSGARDPNRCGSADE
eukprot:6201934-Pleurochrysis_carterae.AAC.1